MKAQVKEGRKVEITIQGNASKVPTKKYKSDKALAELRANNMKSKIEAELKEIDPSIFSITVKSEVTGPEFSEQKKAARSEYYKHQFVQVTVK